MKLVSLVLRKLKKLVIGRILAVLPREAVARATVKTVRLLSLGIRDSIEGRVIFLLRTLHARIVKKNSKMSKGETVCSSSL